jgi:hypothetical protein
MMDVAARVGQTATELAAPVEQLPRPLWDLVRVAYAGALGLRGGGLLLGILLDVLACRCFGPPPPIGRRRVVGSAWLAVAICVWHGGTPRLGVLGVLAGAVLVSAWGQPAPRATGPGAARIAAPSGGTEPG